MKTSEFKPGVYQHYKGGYYLALGLVTHHETGEMFVKYAALRGPEDKKPHRGEEIREYASQGKDSWIDLVDPKTGSVLYNAHEQALYETRTGVVPPAGVRRFTLVGS